MTKSSQIRIEGLKKDDIDAAVEVIRKAFKMNPEAKGPYGFIKMKMKDLKDFRVLKYRESEEKGFKIIGAVGIYRFPFSFPPIKMRGAGLGLVAIHPHYQRKGFGQKLMRGVKYYLSDLGCHACFLYTGSPTFYQKKGWVVGFTDHHYKIKTEKLSAQLEEDLPTHEIKKIQLSRYEANDYNELKKLYSKFNQNFYGTCLREEWFWENLKEYRRDALNNFYFIKKENKILAYFRIKMGDRENKKRLILTEYAVRKRISREKNSSNMQHALKYEPKGQLKQERYIVNFLLDIAEKHKCDEISMKIPETYPIVPLFERLGAQNNCGWLSSKMVAIISLEGFLKKLKVAQGEWIKELDEEQIEKIGKRISEHNTVNLKVKEFILTYNLDNSCIDNKLSTQKEFERREEKEEKFEEEYEGKFIELSVPQFTQMVLGNLTPSELAESEIIEVPKEKLPILDAVFPVKHFHLYHMDRF